MKETLRYDELADALARLGSEQDAAGYHGALCGALCVREAGEIDPMRVGDAPLKAGAAQAAEGAAAVRLLDALRGQSVEAFEGSQMSFSPLLPDDEEDLAQRVRALGAWCEGFLYGLSSGKALSMNSCSPEMKEIVRDFTEFTRAGVGDDEDAELEETAYAELVEYIRVGAQLIYMELHERAPDRVH